MGGEATRFKPGQSGNPAGRPAAATALAKLFRDGTRNGVEIQEFVLGVLRDERAEMRDRRWAAEFAADRGWGRPPQTVEVTGQNEVAPLPDVRGLSIDELRRMAAGEDAGGDDSPSDVH